LKELSFNKNGIRHEPVNHWIMENGVVVAIYQGSRGEKPDLDFVIKYKEKNKRLRAPSHTHWIVDLLLKSQKQPELVKKYIKEWIKIYDEFLPFETAEERNSYQLIYNKKHLNEYNEINSDGGYSIETLSAFIELFVRCEKRTSGAFMFKNLLKFMEDYCEGKKDFYQVVGHSKRV
jgi:hypothetical protein